MKLPVPFAKTKKIMRSIAKAIGMSTVDHSGKKSHTRISSYIILAFIVLNSIAFMVIELVNASIMWKQNLTYTVPKEHIWIFGLILSHHLGLLFNKARVYTGKNEFNTNSNLEDVKSRTGDSETIIEENFSEEEYDVGESGEEG